VSLYARDARNDRISRKNLQLLGMFLVWKLKQESGKEISRVVVQPKDCFAFFFSSVLENKCMLGRDSGMAMNVSKSRKSSKLLLTHIKL